MFVENFVRCAYDVEFELTADSLFGNSEKSCHGFLGQNVMTLVAGKFFDTWICLGEILHDVDCACYAGFLKA